MRPFRGPRLALLPTRISSVAGITWLFRDDFTTDEAAPLASPRTAEPGPGTLTLVQADGEFSISDGKLAFPAQTTPAWGDQGFYGGGFSRIAGRALMASYTATVSIKTSYVLAWSSSQTIAGIGAVNLDTAFLFINVANRIYSTEQGSIFDLNGPVWAIDTAYDLALVLRSSGAFFFIKGGTFVNWTLLWINTAAAAATVYPAFKNFDHSGSFDYLRVRDLPAPFSSDYGIASVNQATPTSGTSYTATADAIHDLTLTAPNPLADEAGLRYRYTDDDNCWKAYYNSAGAARLDSVSAGSATNRISVAAVIAAGATQTIRAIAEGSLHDLYTLASTTWTKRGSQVNVSHLNTNTAIRPYVTGSWTLGALRSYPRTSAAYAELDRT